MNLQEIKAAVSAGKVVHWANEGYVVRKATFADGTEDYYILCLSNDNTIGLTWRDGVTMNGKPEQFFIAA